MDHQFWSQRWQGNSIGFHRSDANPLLVDHFSALALKPGSHIFVPLCGKTLDLRWLVSQGYRVTGIELIEMAVEQLFQEWGIDPQLEIQGELRRYSAPQITVFAGDVFQLSADRLGAVDGIYDRGALVALPSPLRQRYTAHLQAIAPLASQLLLTYEYDQTLRDGPPFAITLAEIQEHYSDRYEITLLSSQEIPGGLFKQYPALEQVWGLVPRPDFQGKLQSGQADGNDR